MNGYYFTYVSKSVEWMRKLTCSTPFQPEMFAENLKYTWIMAVNRLSQ